MNESTKKMKIKTRNVLSLISCVLCLLYISGCFGGNAVRIKVGVKPKVDMKKYGPIAVIDFIDNKSNSLTDDGKMLSRMIRKRLAKNKELNVLDERSMYLLMDEQIDKDKINDPAALIAICKQLGAGAIIVGAFEFRKMSQPVPYVVERYSSSTGRYTPETRTYIQTSYLFSFNAKVIDGETGESVFDYAPRIVKRPESRRSLVGLPLSSGGESKSQSVNLRSIATRPVNTFILSLIPHYEYERRILAQ